MKSPFSSIHGDDGKSNSYLSSSSHEKEPHRSSRGGRRPLTNFDDFKVVIPEFVGKHDADEFIKWLNTVERIFEYKVVPNDKRVKPVGLKLGKYASL